MKRALKWFIALGIVAAVAVLGYGWLRGRGAKGDDIRTVEVTQGSISEKAVAVGQIDPRVKFRVKSKISGIVKRCVVEVGDPVEAGDPLFEIVPDPTPTERVEAERQVQSAESALDKAKADFERSTALHRQGIVSQGELDARREAHEQARIESARARDNLDLLRKGRIAGSGLESVIRAPARGTLLSRLVSEGDSVVPLTSYQEGTDLATIADMSDLVFKGTVDEIDVGKLKLGLAARLRIGALPDATVTGRLDRIAPQATEKDNAKLFEVEITLDPGQTVTLRAGYSATADLVIQEKKDVLVIPERLVTFEDGGRKAWVEVPGDDPEAEPKKVEVQTGLSDGMNVEVVAGLEKGQKVVQRPPKQIEG